MEGSVDNIFQTQRQVTTKVGKPPTRLQKQAPASLLLDQIKINGNNNNNPFARSAESFSSHTPIPLLSPLIVSPPKSPPEAEEFRFPTLIEGDFGCRVNEDGNKFAGFETIGWKHPAVAAAAAGGGYIEPSSLFASFQSKCVLVPHGQ